MELSLFPRDLFAELAVTALGIEVDEFDTIPPDAIAAPEPAAAPTQPPPDDGESIADQGTVVG